MAGQNDIQRNYSNFRRSYLWTLENFSKLEITEKELKTPTVKFAGVEWVMEMRICKECDDNDSRACLSLKLESFREHESKACWEVSLLSKDGSKRRMKQGETLCKIPENIEIFKVSKSFLQSSDFQDFLPNDSLIICLDMVELDMSECRALWKNFQDDESLQCLRSLSSDLLALFQSEEQTDVVLHVGNDSFPAHKLILSARSKVFAKKLLHDDEGKSRYSVFIDDVEPGDVKLMLEYIYSGDIPDIPIDRVYSLYASAVKYEIVGLQRRCMQLITNVLRETLYPKRILCDKVGQPTWGLLKDRIDTSAYYRLLKESEIGENIFENNSYIEICKKLNFDGYDDAKKQNFFSVENCIYYSLFLILIIFLIINFSHLPYFQI